MPIRSKRERDSPIASSNSAAPWNSPGSVASPAGTNSSVMRASTSRASTSSR